MFRDKPSAYDRIHEVMDDIGTRLSDIEAQAADRLGYRPSRWERLRRSANDGLSYLPGFQQESAVSRYWPNFLSGWSLPDSSDARHSLERAQRSLRDGASEARGYLPALSSVQWPEWRAPRRTSFKRGMEAQRGLDYFRHRPELTTALAIGGVAVALGAAFYVSKKIADHAEEPDYEAVRRDGEISIRDYDAMLVAETIKSGYHEKARRAGFETLYDFIRGANRSDKRIAMTIPVLQQLSDGEGQGKGWAIRFVMPKKFAKSTLPAPNSQDVRIAEVEARRMAVVQFTGAFSASLASKKLMSLYNYLADEGLKQKGDPIYAFYNPPWVPGFMRRNEILIEIER